MAIFPEATYSKKLGLPNYSSHSYVVSIRTELQDIAQVPEESTNLYKMLQDAVDKDIQAVGFMPEVGYGMKPDQNGGSQQNRNSGHQQEPAGISEKQLDLINRIVSENNISKSLVEEISVGMFQNGVRSLNRMQASGLIDELFERYPRKQRETDTGASINRHGHEPGSTHQRPAQNHLTQPSDHLAPLSAPVLVQIRPETDEADHTSSPCRACRPRRSEKLEQGPVEE